MPPRTPPSRLARAPAAACVALALALLAVGFATTLPPLGAALVALNLAVMPLSDALFSACWRRKLRREGWRPCPRCGRLLPERFIEIVGFCMACGDARDPPA